MTKKEFLEMMAAWYDNSLVESHISVHRTVDDFFIHSSDDVKKNYPVDFIMCGDKVEITAKPVDDAEGPFYGKVRAVKATPKGKCYYVNDNHWVAFGWFNEEDVVKL